jgi:8-oxo-dGTP diphosphatase
VLKRPVVGIVAVARTRDGRMLLVRRRDTGQWALPGGTLEWGETLAQGLRRELREEAGAEIVHLGGLCGVYSRPDRDPRFHAVTVVVRVEVAEPHAPPQNPLEIAEARLFARADLPARLAFGMEELVEHAALDTPHWE